MLSGHSSGCALAQALRAARLARRSTLERCDCSLVQAGHFHPFARAPDTLRARTATNARHAARQ
eukprot:10175126-Alexandrium_andersonii.AAC.1